MTGPNEGDKKDAERGVEPPSNGRIAGKQHMLIDWLHNFDSTGLF
jgi:hypothetical protein